MRHHPGVEPYPEDSDRKQGLTRTAEMGISFVPVVGSALQVAFNEVAGRRLADRRTGWLNDLAEKVNSLEGRIGDFAKLTSEDAFMDALTTAARIADRTSRAEKLQALRNAVVNSVMPGAPDLDAQQLFFDMIDRFTPMHVRILQRARRRRRPGRTRPGSLILTGSWSDIARGIPELAGNPSLIEQYEPALLTTGAVDEPGPEMTLREGRGPRVTPFGVKFLAFIADPGR
jgi:hypothetical protein